MSSFSENPHKRPRLDKTESAEWFQIDKALHKHVKKSFKNVNNRCKRNSKEIKDSSNVPQQDSPQPSFSKASTLLRDSKDKKQVETLAKSDKVLSNASSPRIKIASNDDDRGFTCSIENKRHAEKCSQTYGHSRITSYFDIKIVKKGEYSVTETDTTTSKENPISAEKKSTKVVKNNQKNESFFQKYNYCYGLLGENYCDEKNKTAYFERMPEHVLENILSQLPHADMMLCRLVCKQWNNVIKDKQFMVWKKMYYSLKRGDTYPFDLLGAICSDKEVSIVEHCFPCIIRYMVLDFGKKPSSDMYLQLLLNSKAVDAELLFKERFPDLMDKDSKVWGIFAAAFLLSETVEDVYSIYKSVYNARSGCCILDIFDAMYCIATFLLHFRNAYAINHGLHYRLYCALYWIENNIPRKDLEGGQSLKVVKGLPGQQSLHSYVDVSKSSLTYEQLRILNHCFQPGQIVKIVALAGTGKTTTLINLARLYPQVNFLNVMFNKAVCEDAKKRFPPNVTCRTAHSLAYGPFGFKLKSKLSRKIRPHDIIIHLQFQEGSALHIHSYAKHVLSTIETFVFSSDNEILLDHVSRTQTDSGMRPIYDRDRKKILKDAVEIWKKMIDADNKNVRITHDVYLKLYQLSCPKLVGFQCLMVDEAQDCNPAMISIMMSQRLPLVCMSIKFCTVCCL